MQAAREAVANAVNAEADIYAQYLFVVAQDSLNQAEMLLTEKKYADAKRLALFAKSWADTSVSIAQINKEGVKTSAEATINNATSKLEILKESKTPSELNSKLNEELKAIKIALIKARNALELGNYQDAFDIARDAINIVDKAIAIKNGYREQVITENKQKLIWDAIENGLKTLKEGRILFHTPREMVLGLKERVEIRITESLTTDLHKGLKGRGVSEVEKINVGPLMIVRLTGDNFDIKELSHQSQPVLADSFTQWDYDITPLKSGNQTLLLMISVRLRFLNGLEEIKDYSVFEKEIVVKVNIKYLAKKFINSNWQWLIGIMGGAGIISSIFIAIKNTIKNRRKRVPGFNRENSS